MSDYLIISGDQVANLKGYGERDGEPILWKAIDPISVYRPPEKFVLPAEAKDDQDFIEAFPQLDALPIENENEILFWDWDENGNPIPPVTLKSLRVAPTATIVEVGARTKRVVIKPFAWLWNKIKTFFKKLWRNIL